MPPRKAEIVSLDVVKQELKVTALDVEYGPRIHEPTFKPCVLQSEEVGLTSIILEDTITIFHPLTRGGQPKGHFVDLGYDPEGNLVAVQIWACVKRVPTIKPKKAPPRKQRNKKKEGKHGR